MNDKKILGLGWVLFVAITAACNVEEKSPDTGGLGASGGEGGASGSGGTGGSDGVDYRGAAVVNSDYVSTSVSLLGPDGEVLSPVFISSSSEEPGLSTPLSGDVTVSSTDALGQELVLVDRSESVLTWANLASAKVRDQLNVGTGFVANPHDYLEISQNKAYVTRFAENLDAGKEDFDAGSDVLVIDPSVPEITGSIDLKPVLGNAADFTPSADSILLAGERVLVTLLGLKADFSDTLETRVVAIDPESDEITETLIVDGKKNCGPMALSPHGDMVALACTGAFAQDPADGYPDAGVVLLKVGDELELEQTFDARAFGDAQVSGVAYVDETHLLVTTYGSFGALAGAGTDDQAFLLDLEDEGAEPILSATPYSLGGSMRCIDRNCFLADAAEGTNAIRRLEFDGKTLALEGSIEADTETGLPPRGITRF